MILVVLGGVAFGAVFAGVLGLLVNRFVPKDVLRRPLIRRRR